MAKVKSESVIYGCDACNPPNSDDAAELQKIGSFTSRPKNMSVNAMNPNQAPPQTPEGYEAKTFDVYQCPVCRTAHIMMNGQFIDEHFQENITPAPVISNMNYNQQRYNNQYPMQQNQQYNPYGNNYNPYWNNPYMPK